MAGPRVLGTKIVVRFHTGDPFYNHESDYVNIPESWKKYIRHVRETFPHAVIAGGCLRDLDLGRSPKDIDIFVPGTNQEMLNDFIKKNEIIPVRDVKSYGEFSNQEVDRVVTYFEPTLNGLAVEFISVDIDPSNMLNRFDFGLCQVLYDGNEFRFTGNYLKDKALKQFTLIRCDNQEQYNRSVRRWENLRDKFPEYSFNPGEYGSKYGRPRLVSE